jgi:hypothetical protein
MVPEAIGRGSGCGAGEPPQPAIASRKSMAARQTNRPIMRVFSESPNFKLEQVAANNIAKPQDAIANLF